MSLNFAFYLPGALLNLRGNSILKDICKMRTKSNNQNAGCAFVMGAGGRGSSTWELQVKKNLAFPPLLKNTLDLA